MTIVMRWWRFEGHASTDRAVLVLRFVNVTAFAKLHGSQLSKLVLKADVFRVLNWDCTTRAFNIVKTISTMTSLIINELLLIPEGCSQSGQHTVPCILFLNFRSFRI